MDNLTRNSSPSVMMHAPPQKEPEAVRRCEAIFDFSPEENGELSFVVGDVIEVAFGFPFVFV